MLVMWTYSPVPPLCDVLFPRGNPLNQGVIVLVSPQFPLFFDVVLYGYGLLRELPFSFFYPRPTLFFIGLFLRCSLVPLFLDFFFGLLFPDLRLRCFFSRCIDPTVPFHFSSSGFFYFCSPFPFFCFPLLGQVYHFSGDLSGSRTLLFVFPGPLTLSPLCSPSWLQSISPIFLNVTWREALCSRSFLSFTVACSSATVPSPNIDLLVFSPFPPPVYREEFLPTSFFVRFILPTFFDSVLK